ncbi:Abhydrolase-3 domain-containing protein [Mycena chlorophos]|uniref:Abhydrolase-3 domain-containing protein n=1 Tax=Mycena chlorophos TaxID=658473 RepID=A0A8H6SBY5_MYCCL|nr:Abhydrolase-3 domain-containing protein [Mycena chlorophos]
MTGMARYGDLPLAQKLRFVAIALSLPVIVLSTALTNLLPVFRATHNKTKSLKRILGEGVMRYLFTHLRVSQLQWASGTTSDVYTKWAIGKQAAVVDEIQDSEGARLCWVGPKRADRVLLYLHGGCFHLPVTDFTLDFLRYIQLELEKQGIDIGVAVLEYCAFCVPVIELVLIVVVFTALAPYAQFPIPLLQTTLAIQHLTSLSPSPQLVIAGDSAGGHLALQVLSHMLHPNVVPDIPTIQSPSRIAGICLLSPWASLSTTSASAAINDGIDVVPRKVVQALGAALLPAFSASASGDATAAMLPFAEPSGAPVDWFARLEQVTARLLVTCGSGEVMRDDILRLAGVLQEASSTGNGPGAGTGKEQTEVTLLEQAGGVHDDMLLDFMVKEDVQEKEDALTPAIVSWLAECWMRELEA